MTNNKVKIYVLYNDVDDYTFIGYMSSTIAQKLTSVKHAAGDKRPLDKHYNKIGWDKLKIKVVDQVDKADAKATIEKLVVVQSNSLNKYRARTIKPKVMKPRKKKKRIFDQEFNCFCGSKILRTSQVRHESTPWHQLYITKHKLWVSMAALKAGQQ